MFNANGQKPVGNFREIYCTGETFEKVCFLQFNSEANYKKQKK